MQEKQVRLAAPLLAALAVQAGCAPGLARGIPLGEVETTARLVQMFPAGTPETELLAYINRHGYRISRLGDEKIATRTWQSLDHVCGMSTMIRWRADGEKRIVGLAGDSGASPCL